MKCWALAKQNSTTTSISPTESTTSTTSNLQQSNETIRVTSLANGQRLLKLLELIRKSHSLEDITTSVLILNTGMLLLKLTKRRLLINYVSQDRLRPMNGYRNQQKLKDKQAVKWKKRDFLLIQELINLCDPIPTSIHRCGWKEEMKLLYSFRG